MWEGCVCVWGGACMDECMGVWECMCGVCVSICECGCVWCEWDTP